MKKKGEPVAQYFSKGKIQALKQELEYDKRDPKRARKKETLKRIIANMTTGTDMSGLFNEVIDCIQSPLLEIKKMVYLYLVNYAKQKASLAVMAVNSLQKDASDHNPIIRALAIRTMSYIHVDQMMDALCEPLTKALKDEDPYVRKTAVFCVAKMYSFSPEMVESNGFLDSLRGLLGDSNPMVVANTVACLTEINEMSSKEELKIDASQAGKLLTALNDCSEWAQTYILSSLMFHRPADEIAADTVILRVIPRLQHANSSVVLATVRLIIYMTNFIPNPETTANYLKKISPSLVTLMTSSYEVQYVVLRNVILIIQKYPDFLKDELKIFFCKYDDPTYVKLAKLEILVRLATASNMDLVLSELVEYAGEVDVEFGRKAVRSIGRCAIKIESCSEKCVTSLLELIQTKVNYIVQEAIIVIKDIFRRYPNKYEGVIGTLCQNLDSLDEPEAKAAMIRIVGQYSDRIENSAELLEGFVDTMKEDPPEVQLALLTAVVQLFVKRPKAGQELVPKVLKWVTEECDNPDLRDRGFIYWRLLSTNPDAAKAIILGDRPPISTETEKMDPTLLQELMLHISSLASIYHKPPAAFIGDAKQREIPALGTQNVEKRDFNQYQNNPYAIENAPNPIQQNAVNLLDLDFEEVQSPEGGDYFSPTNAHQVDYTTGQGQGGFNAENFMQSSNIAAAPYQGSYPASVNPFIATGYQAPQAIPSSTTQSVFSTQQQFVSAQSNMFSGNVAVTETKQTFATVTSGNVPAFGTPSDNFGLNFNYSVGPSQKPSDLNIPKVAPSAPFGNKPANMLFSPSPTTTVMPFGNISTSVAPLEKSGDRLYPQGVLPSIVPNTATNIFGGIESMAPTSPQVANLAIPIMQKPSQGSSSVPANSLLNELLDLNINQGYASPKYLMHSSKGLEIWGTFLRQTGQVILQLTLKNIALQAIGDFSIFINQNSFGMSVTGPLDLRGSLLPNTTADAIVKIQCNGPRQPCTPFNSLQFAMKTNIGIMYFQTIFPLYIVFLEKSQLEQNTFLFKWNELPDSPNCHFMVEKLASSNPDAFRGKLVNNNIHVVAQRRVNDMEIFFTNVKTEDQMLYLMEIRLTPSTNSCAVNVKTTYLAGVEALKIAVETILQSS